MSFTLTNVSWEAGGRTILHDVDLKIQPGVFTGVLGPNGSGKTSLLHLLAGVHRPTSGELRLGDMSLASLRSRERARRIALLEQHATTGLDLTVRDVVELGRIPHRSRWPGAVHADAACIERAMHRSRVTELADRRWATLSGGERQRVQLARALAQEPEVLLLDEPTNHLDLGHQIAFLRTVREVAPTTVAALHDLDLAAAFCDDVIVVHRGCVVAHGPVDDVLDAALVSEVYGVDAVVETHPVAGRRTVVWVQGGEHTCRRVS
ncbi:ABC transporter ATP-binding protein [Aeromicrobium camelliae]|uniref:ABC transporter ATP-binding protein n=1 Tax=Aeromicrobium camelliae TaxID=1538144 RepID=A0A3N6X3R6_9ACTN|nr:ABC transporter ATP-binding protein [Aeromicrobium camelliae]